MKVGECIVQRAGIGRSLGDDLRGSEMREGSRSGWVWLVFPPSSSF